MEFRKHPNECTGYLKNVNLNCIYTHYWHSNFLLNSYFLWIETFPPGERNLFSSPDLLNQLSNYNSPNPRPMTTKALTLTIKFSWGQETLLLVKLPGTQGVPARLTEMSTVLGWTFQWHSSFESPCSCNPHQLIKLPSDTTVSWACPLFPFWGEQLLFFSHIFRQSQNQLCKERSQASLYCHTPSPASGTVPGTTAVQQNVSEWIRELIHSHCACMPVCHFYSEETEAKKSSYG